jgi:hypothetical protein
VAYPATLDTCPLTSNGVTDADELLFNGIIDALSRTQQYGGTTAEAPSSAPGASLSARLAAVEALAVGGSAPTASPVRRTGRSARRSATPTRIRSSPRRAPGSPCT